MANPNEILSPAEYRNYRNLRAVAVLYVVFGMVLVFGGIALLVEQNPKPGQEVHPAGAALIMCIGACGAIGGFATLRGSRRWAPLIYVMAILYLCAFPIGTILSYVALTGLSRYLDSSDRIRQAGA